MNPDDIDPMDWEEDSDEPDGGALAGCAIALLITMAVIAAAWVLIAVLDLWRKP